MEIGDRVTVDHYDFDEVEKCKTCYYALDYFQSNKSIGTIKELKPNGAFKVDFGAPMLITCCPFHQLKKI